MSKENRRPDTFDDRNMPENSLSKVRELEIDKKVEALLPEALKNLKKHAIITENK